MKPVKFSFCHSSFVYNSIQNYKNKTLILDTRDSDSFIRTRIADSINICSDRIQRLLQADCNSTELSQVTAANLAKLFDGDEAQKYSERKRRSCMIITSENAITSEFISEAKALAEVEPEVETFDISETSFNDTLRALLERIQEENSVSIALEIFKILHRDRVPELHILVDGSSDFFDRYPFLNQHFANPLIEDCLVVAQPLKIHEFPHDILDGKLFLGNCVQSKQLDLLNRLKITHIVNAAYECANAHEGKGVKYMKLFIRDETEDCMSPHFKEAYEFIEQIFQEGSNKRVLVHCALGKSRSAIIVIMYIMKKFSWGFKKAYEYVKSRRSLISPFHGFVKELETLEKNEFQFEKQSSTQQPESEPEENAV